MSYHVNNTLETTGERFNFLQRAYPDMGRLAVQNTLRAAETNRDLATSYHRFGFAPSNADIPITNNLPYGTRTYRMWVKVTVSFGGGNTDERMAGEHTTIVQVTQPGPLDIEGAYLAALDPGISQMIGDDTIGGVSHGDVYTDVQYELIGIARSNFGRG